MKATSGGFGGSDAQLPRNLLLRAWTWVAPDATAAAWQSDSSRMQLPEVVRERATSREDQGALRRASTELGRNYRFDTRRVSVTPQWAHLKNSRSDVRRPKEGANTKHTFCVFS